MGSDYASVAQDSRSAMTAPSFKKVKKATGKKRAADEDIVSVLEKIGGDDEGH